MTLPIELAALDLAGTTVDEAGLVRQVVRSRAGGRGQPSVAPGLDRRCA